MTTSPIVIEERLRSNGLAAVLGVLLLRQLAGGLREARNSRSNSPQWMAKVVAGASALLFLLCFTLALRIVARVIDGPTGRTFEVLYGPGGLVRQVFGPEEIVGASARKISLFRTGGWGYRGSLRFLRRAAVVTRRGDALELQLIGKRRFIVTVDEPDAFVSALATTQD